MQSETTEPAIRVGQLPADFCPGTWQELAEAIASIYDIPTATGRAGSDGSDGQDGSDSSGDGGTAPSATINTDTVTVSDTWTGVEWQPTGWIAENRDALVIDLCTVGTTTRKMDDSGLWIAQIDLWSGITGSGDTAIDADATPEETPVRVYFNKPAALSDTDNSTYVLFRWWEFDNMDAGS